MPFFSKNSEGVEGDLVSGSSAPAEPASGRAAEGSNDPVGSKWVRYLILVMKLAAILCSACAALLYGWLIYEGAQTDKVILAKVLATLSSFFYIVFCLFIVAAELEVERFLMHFGFMHAWPGRGLVQLFVAVDFLNAKEETQLHSINLSEDLQSTVNTITEVIGFTFVAIAVLYILMGVTCLRPLADRTEKSRLKRKEFEEYMKNQDRKKKSRRKKRRKSSATIGESSGRFGDLVNNDGNIDQNEDFTLGDEGRFLDDDPVADTVLGDEWDSERNKPILAAAEAAATTAAPVRKAHLFYDDEDDDENSDDLLYGPGGSPPAAVPAEGGDGGGSDGDGPVDTPSPLPKQRKWFNLRGGK